MSLSKLSVKLELCIYSLTEPGRPKGISKAGNKREKDFQVEKILYIRRLSLECIHANTDTYTQTHARNRLPNASSTHSTTALPPAGCFFPSCRVRGKKTFFFLYPVIYLFRICVVLLSHSPTYKPHLGAAARRSGEMVLAQPF